MAATLIFLAGALASPEVDRAFSRRVQERYPMWALSESQQTSAAVELAVLPDGSVADCSVLKSVGNAQLAAEACAGTIGFKMKPAVDSNGNPTFGLLRTVITMTLSPAPKRLRPLVSEPDVELTVDRLPDGEALDLVIALLVSSDGSIEQCEGRRRTGGSSSDAAYFHAACEQAKGLRGRVIHDASGAAVQYVTSLRVRFSLDPALAG